MVVLPCVPATAIVRCSAVSSASSSARGRSGSARVRAACALGVLGRHGRGVHELDALPGGGWPMADVALEHAVGGQALE